MSKSWNLTTSDEEKARQTIVPVHYYTCDCDYISKYCDEYHTAYARIPKSVLDEYRV